MRRFVFAALAVALFVLSVMPADFGGIIWDPTPAAYANLIWDRASS